jgi:hypothetical protein
MAKRKRVTATVKMTYHDDTDLIAWWNSIPRGSRNAVMKAAMRAYIGYEDYVLQENPAEKGGGIDTTRFDQLCDDAAWTRDALHALPDYVEEVVRHVADNVVVNQPETARSSDKDRSMSDEAARRREDRMKRRQW